MARPTLTETARLAAAERAARQATALRANLRRRKDQGRARAQEAGMRLSGCIEMLFAREHAAFPDRIRACKAAGLDAVEFWNWRDKDIDGIAAASAATGLPVEVFSVEPRARLVDPATHETFLRGLRETIPVARRLGTTRLIALSGDELPGVDRAAQHAALVAGLRAAAPIAEDAGITLALEPLNTALDHVGYFLDRTAEGFAVVEEVASPAVRLLYDIYHSAMMGEDPAAELAGKGTLVGYVHAADRPGRNEPGSGVIDWHAAAAALRREGYAGPVGLEFRPTGATEAALAAVREQLA